MSSTRCLPDPVTVERLMRLDIVIWNLLGLKEPEQVAAWINGARHELAECRAEHSQTDAMKP